MVARGDVHDILLSILARGSSGCDRYLSYSEVFFNVLSILVMNI